MDAPNRKSSEVVLGENISFPAYGDRSLSSQVVFVTGKRGSGKSWTTGVMMEELEKSYALSALPFRESLILVSRRLT